MARLIDLSKPIRYNAEDPWFMRVKIKHKPHSRARWLIRFLGLPFRLFPTGFQGWADDTIQSMGVLVSGDWLADFKPWLGNQPCCE